jgi:pimeloyl-ACP methyl ester carboxylesterase
MPAVRVRADQGGSPSPLDLWVEEQGTGHAVLLVMGLGAQLVFWPEELVADLAERGFRAIRFDNRDVGLSSKLDHLGVPDLRRAIRQRVLGGSPSSPYTLDDMADDAARLLDALGVDRAHVVGASMGGMIAQLLAIRHPDRVKTLASIMSHTGEYSHLLVAPRVIRVLLQSPPRTAEQALANQLATFRVVGTQPFDEALARENIGRSVDRGFHPPGTARQLAAVLAAPARTSALRALRVPSLVIHGSADVLVPPRGGRATAAAIPGARYVEYAGMGHDLPRTAWMRLARDLTDFWRASAA